MVREKALQVANRLANSQGVQLGGCLFADDAGNGWWGFSFDIVDGPTDWSWTVVVNDAERDMVLFAAHFRPAPILAPGIRSRCWFLICWRLADMAR